MQQEQGRYSKQAKDGKEPLPGNDGTNDTGTGEHYVKQQPHAVVPGQESIQLISGSRIGERQLRKQSPLGEKINQYGKKPGKYNPCNEFAGIKACFVWQKIVFLCNAKLVTGVKYGSRR